MLKITTSTGTAPRMVPTRSNLNTSIKPRLRPATSRSQYATRFRPPDFIRPKLGISYTQYSDYAYFPRKTIHKDSPALTNGPKCGTFRPSFPLAHGCGV